MEYTEYFVTTQEETDSIKLPVREADVSVKRNYKDTVFRMLFREKTALLSLYNAVNGTHFTNAEDLEITTLDNAVYMGMKNDVSCVFDFDLSLYEHQSTANPNIPLRDLFYVTGQLQKLVQEKNLYSSRKMQIPTPRFVVFYNGSAAMPEQMEYRLSDLFQKQVASPELELIVTVYNINPGMNNDLLEACQLLKEYMLFTNKIRENRKMMDLETAVNKAVDACIKEGILAEFLKAQRAEVVAMSIFEYDAKKHIRLEKEESYAEGKAEGKAESIILLLKEKGSLPKEIEQKIIMEKDENLLNEWLISAAASDSIEKFIKEV